jgi:hypothetical protein
MYAKGRLCLTLGHVYLSGLVDFILFDKNPSAWI